MKQILLIMAVMVMSVLHAFPQNAGDTSGIIAPGEEMIIFRFKPTKDILLADYYRNRENLARFTKLIEDNKADILEGKLVVRVSGYCNSKPTAEENLAIAKIRSNHVKSWFIVNNNLKEEHYRTYNAARSWNGMSDVVAVAYLEVAGGPAEPVTESSEQPPIVELVPPVIETEEEPVAEGESVVLVPSVEEEPSFQPLEPGQPEFIKPKRGDARPLFSVKTNVYYWSGMMPDFKHYSFLPNLSVEWFFADKWSVQASGAYVQHRLDDREFFGASAYSIEPRYWFKDDGLHNWFYAGIYGEFGDFDNQYMHIDDYRTGNHYGVGLSLGAYVPITRRLGVELGLRGGFISKDIDYYTRQTGGYFKDRSQTKNKFDLTGVNISVSYRFLNER